MSNKLGSAIRIFRNAAEMSPAELAKHASIGVPFLSLVEHGKRNPSIEVLYRIAEALKIPTDVLVLLAAPEDSQVHSSNDKTAMLMGSYNKLIEAENHLKILLSNQRTRNTKKQVSPKKSQQNTLDGTK